MKTFNCKNCAMEALCSPPPGKSYCNDENNYGFYNIGLYIETQRVNFRKEWYQYANSMD